VDPYPLKGFQGYLRQSKNDENFDEVVGATLHSLHSGWGNKVLFPQTQQILWIIVKSPDNCSRLNETREIRKSRVEHPTRAEDFNRFQVGKYYVRN
jgi:hypothetical protein